MNEAEHEKPRWHNRLDNFRRAYFLLSEGIDALTERQLSQLEREGRIRRFKYAWELAWRTIADYVADQGILVTPATPRAVIRAAFEARVITDGDEWMAALDARDKMSHTYDFKVFETVIEQVRDRFLGLFADLYAFMTEQASAG